MTILSLKTSHSYRVARDLASGLRHQASKPWLAGMVYAGIPLLGLGLLVVMPARAAIVLDVRQQAGNVTITGRGSANLTGLTAAGSSSTWTNSLTQAEVYTGPYANFDGSVNLWDGLTGPLAISGNSIYELPDATGNTGELFGILADNGSGVSQLVLPPGYVSGNSLDGFSIYSNTDFATIGLSPGIFTWRWGSGSNADTLQVRILNPNPAKVPGPLPLAGAAIAYSWAKLLRLRSHRLVGRL